MEDTTGKSRLVRIVTELAIRMKDPVVLDMMQTVCGAIQVVLAIAFGQGR